MLCFKQDFERAKLKRNVIIFFLPPVQKMPIEGTCKG